MLCLRLRRPCAACHKAQSSNHSYSNFTSMISTNSSSSLFAFYLFADDSNIILANNNLKELESLVNRELGNVIERLCKISWLNDWFKSFMEISHRIYLSQNQQVDGNYNIIDSALCPTSCFTFSLQLIVPYLTYGMWLGKLCLDISKKDRSFTKTGLTSHLLQ